MFDIVVTGIGIVSSLGVGREAFWKNISVATSGIKKIRHFDTATLRCDIAASVEDFEPKDFMKPQTYRRMSRVSKMAVASSIEAIKDSGLPMDQLDKNRIAVVMGTSYGSSSCVEDFYVGFLEDGPGGAHPFLFPETVPNAPASHIAMFHGITGPNTTFSQNQISSENAIVYAKNLLTEDHADIVLVAGADELSYVQLFCYNALGVLNNTKVKGNCLVLPKCGGGLILGEGAGVLILENSNFAKKRKARVLGRLRSGVITGGTASIGHYESGGEQAFRAMHEAIEQAGVEPDEIDHVNVSANFLSELDHVEYMALKRIFKDKPGNLAITPLKYFIGDFGGAGVTRAAAILLSFQFGKPLPNISVEVLLEDGGHVLEWKTNGEGPSEIALMTTTTFGGGSACLIWTK